MKAREEEVGKRKRKIREVGYCRYRRPTVIPLMFTVVYCAALSLFQEEDHMEIKKKRIERREEEVTMREIKYTKKEEDLNKKIEALAKVEIDVEKVSFFQILNNFKLVNIIIFISMPNYDCI